MSDDMDVLAPGHDEDVSVAGAMRELNRIARELDQRSRSLWNTELELAQLHEAYDEEFAEYEAEWYRLYEAGEKKWPADATRHRIFREERMKDSEAVRRMLFLERKSKRLKDRIHHLATEADGQRSVLSALKVEMEATR